MQIVQVLLRKLGRGRIMSLAASIVFFCMAGWVITVTNGTQTNVNVTLKPARSSNPPLDEKETPEKCQYKGLTEEEIFSGNFKGGADDVRLVGYVRKCILIPPSTLPYNLTKPTGDPSEGQRKYVHKKWLGNKRNGTFIECAAFDGEYLSNTLVLERDFGWTGLLIEADANNIKMLKSKNRKSWVAGVCASVHPYPSKVEMFKNGAGGMLIDTAGIHAYPKNTRFELLEAKKIALVNCFPLYTIMLAANMTEVDYLSVDIEESDYPVLKNLPFDRIGVKVLSVETKSHTMNKMRALMNSRNYTMVKRIDTFFAHDDVYVHNSLRDLSAPKHFLDI